MPLLRRFLEIYATKMIKSDLPIELLKRVKRFQGEFDLSFQMLLATLKVGEKTLKDYYYTIRKSIT